MTVDSLLRSVTSLVLSSDIVSLLLSVSSIMIGELLVTSKLFIPLLSSLCYSALLVVVMGYRLHSWVALLVASLLWKLAWLLLVP